MRNKRAADTDGTQKPPDIVIVNLLHAKNMALIGRVCGLAYVFCFVATATFECAR